MLLSLMLSSTPNIFLPISMRALTRQDPAYQSHTQSFPGHLDSLPALVRIIIWCDFAQINSMTIGFDWFLPTMHPH